MFGIHQSLALLLRFSLWANQGSHVWGFSRWFCLFVTFWLAESVRVIGHKCGLLCQMDAGWICFDYVVNTIQTHKRLKWTSFIRAKYNIQIFVVIPFVELKTTLKQQLNGEKWDVELGHLSAAGGAMLSSCPVLGRSESWLNVNAVISTQHSSQSCSGKMLLNI